VALWLQFGERKKGWPVGHEECWPSEIRLGWQGGAPDEEGELSSAVGKRATSPTSGVLNSAEWKGEGGGWETTRASRRKREKGQ